MTDEIVPIGENICEHQPETMQGALWTCDICLPPLPKLPEPTPPTETHSQKFAMALELLESTLPFTQCDSGCHCEGDQVFQETVAFLKAHKVAAPTERVETILLLDAMVRDFTELGRCSKSEVRRRIQEYALAVAAVAPSPAPAINQEMLGALKVIAAATRGCPCSQCVEIYKVIAPVIQKAGKL